MRPAIVAVALLSYSLATAQQLPKLEIIPVRQDLTFWSISVVSDQVVWVGANKGTVGRSVDGGKSWAFTVIKSLETREFRSIYAFSDLVAVTACVGSPAFILRTTDGGENWSRVYENAVPEAFIDGIDFWNDNDGLAYGDPIAGRMLLLKTTDGGLTWSDGEVIPPPLAEGEASFASSGTGIRCVSDAMAVIATGGLVSRLFTSHDKGKTWQPSNPMLRQGSKTGGIFSVSFVNEHEGVVVGGDFADSTASELCLITSDGGHTWTLPSKPPRGTRWCVEHLSESTLIAAGPSGLEIGSSGGKTWFSPIEGDTLFHVARKSRNGRLVVVAGRKSRLALIR